MASTSPRDVAIDGLINDLQNLKQKLNAEKVRGARFSKEVEAIRESEAWKALRRETEKVFRDNDPEEGLATKLEGMGLSVPIAKDATRTAKPVAEGAVTISAPAGPSRPLKRKQASKDVIQIAKAKRYSGLSSVIIMRTKQEPSKKLKIHESALLSRFPTLKKLLSVAVADADFYSVKEITLYNPTVTKEKRSIRETVIYFEQLVTSRWARGWANHIKDMGLKVGWEAFRFWVKWSDGVCDLPLEYMGEVLDMGWFLGVDEEILNGFEEQLPWVPLGLRRR